MPARQGGLWSDEGLEVYSCVWMDLRRARKGVRKPLMGDFRLGKVAGSGVQRRSEGNSWKETWFEIPILTVNVLILAYFHRCSRQILSSLLSVTKGVTFDSV